MRGVSKVSTYLLTAPDPSTPRHIGGGLDQKCVDSPQCSIPFAECVEGVCKCKLGFEIIDGKCETKREADSVTKGGKIWRFAYFRLFLSFWRTHNTAAYQHACMISMVLTHQY